MNAAVRAEFNLFGKIKRVGRWYIAHCPPLDVSSQGRTVAEAKENLQEAAELFLESCIERGVLDQALRELGFVPSKNGAKRLPTRAFPLCVAIPLRFQKSA